MGLPSGGRIRLDGGEAEVWAWEREVRGCCCGGSAGCEVTLRVNDSDVPVRREGERFSAVVPLKEGRNRVVAWCRGADGRECCSHEITLEQRLRSRPKARIAVSVGPEGILLDGSASSPGEASGAPIASYRWRARRGNPERLTIRPAQGPRALVRPPGSDGEYYVSLKVVDAEGRADTARSYFVVDSGRPRPVAWETENAGWVEEAVVYGVMPLYFGPHGFQSVIERLEHLQDLGIAAMWLSPCNATADPGHGYGVSGYFSLRRDYGTKADFRRLVKEAHARGIRVLMDFVPNHTAMGHPYMKDAAARGKASPYYDFYDRNPETGEHTHYFDWTHLPNLNYDNPEVRRWMLEAFSYWVREFDVDGFRVDVAWGIKLRRPDFWPEWRRELKRIKPDLLLLAEASARDPYYFTEGFDAAYDWTDELGHWAMERVFEDPGQIVPRLHAALTNEGRGFHEDALVFRFTNNNDTGPRFITRHGLGRERVAAAMLLTLPGLPCLYTGQEVGAEFEPYRTSGPICWEDRHGLSSYYRRLIALRRGTPSLHSRRWEILAVESEAQVYAYARYNRAGGEPALVVLNFSEEQAEVAIGLTEGLGSLALRRELSDALNEERVAVRHAGERQVRVAVPGCAARILIEPQAEVTRAAGEGEG